MIGHPPAAPFAMTASRGFPIRSLSAQPRSVQIAVLQLLIVPSADTMTRVSIMLRKILFM